MAASQTPSDPTSVGMDDHHYTLGSLDPVQHKGVLTHGGLVDLTENNLLKEISAIFPTPDSIPSTVPLVIIQQGSVPCDSNIITEPPAIARKSRTRQSSDPDFILTDDDLVNLEPVAEKRYPSRVRRGLLTQKRHYV